MKNDELPTLVILTTHFGTNFSGGSTATCEIFSRIQEQFQKVIVVGTEIGTHSFQRLEFIPYLNWRDALKKLSTLSTLPKAIFYGDFYNSFLYILSGIPFYFTYHDNWPELGRQGLSNRLRSLFYNPVYKSIFRKAERVFTVSEFKSEWVRKQTSKNTIIRNGFQKHPAAPEPRDQEILMVGTIDSRKYRYAIQLFKKLQTLNQTPKPKVHIFGHIGNHQISEHLKAFSFVELKGYQEVVPYSRYKILLHTSAMENLPLVFCEAISHDLPILTFNVGGNREVVTPANGKLIAPYNIEAMAKSLIEITSKQTPHQSDPSCLDDYRWDKAASSYQKLMLHS